MIIINIFFQASFKNLIFLIFDVVDILYEYKMEFNIHEGVESNFMQNLNVQ